MQCILDDGINTQGPMGKMVTTVLAAVAQAERERILERTNEGRRAAMNRGIRMGRKPSISQAAREQAVKMVAEGVPKATVAKELGFSRQKLYDILDELGLSGRDDRFARKGSLSGANSGEC